MPLFLQEKLVLKNWCLENYRSAKVLRLKNGCLILTTEGELSHENSPLFLGFCSYEKMPFGINVNMHLVFPMGLIF